MLTVTSEYALQALVYVAQSESEELISGKRIAEETGVPANYLSAVLRELVRNGVLVSTRGKNGGFQLARSADRILLIEALTPFEPVLSARRPCPFGNDVCSDENPCLGHDRWKVVRDSYSRFLNSTTLQDVSFEKKPSLRLAPPAGTRRKKAAHKASPARKKPRKTGRPKKRR